MRLSALSLLLLLSTPASAEAICSVRNDTNKIVLRFTRPHGPEIAIVTPDDRLYFLGERYYPGVTDPPPPFTEAEARALEQIDIDPATYKLRPFRADVIEQEPVFTVSGKYEVRVSENLQTDDDTPYDRCVIEFAK
jgi:hypothetical protein